MDYEVNAHERHHFNSASEAFGSEIWRLVTYINRINHLDSLNLDYMRIVLILNSLRQKLKKKQTYQCMNYHKMIQSG